MGRLAAHSRVRAEPIIIRNLLPTRPDELRILLAQAGPICGAHSIMASKRSLPTIHPIDSSYYHLYSIGIRRNNSLVKCRFRSHYAILEPTSGI